MNTHPGVCCWRGRDRRGNVFYMLLGDLEEMTISAQIFMQKDNHYHIIYKIFFNWKQFNCFRIIYRHVLDICITRLYPITFLNLCIRYHNCFINILGFAVQKIMSSANKELSLSSLQLYTPLPLSLPYCTGEDFWCNLE